MEQLRGSNAQALASILLALLGLMLLNSELIESTKHWYVGGKNGWNIDIQSWPNGKVFHAKDVLVFKYAGGFYNVVTVNKQGYEKCQPNEDSNIYISGQDYVKLHKGMNYFICTVSGRCLRGMKMAVKAV